MGGKGVEKELQITETTLPNQVVVAGTLNTDENKAIQNHQGVDCDGAVELGDGIEVQEDITTERVWGYLQMYDKSLKPTELKRLSMDMGNNCNVHLKCLHKGVVEGFALASFLFNTSMSHFLAFIGRLKSNRPHMIVEGFVKECNVADDSNSPGYDTDEGSTGEAEDSDSGDDDSDDSGDEGFEGLDKDDLEYPQSDIEKQSPSLDSRPHCRN